MGAQAKATADKSAARREQAAVLHESITAKVAQGIVKLLKSPDLG